jgi:histidyl-tRNA synthetase
MSGMQKKGQRIEMDFAGKSLKSQMRRADKFNAHFTLILGDDELAKGAAALKNMDAGTQTEVKLEVDALCSAIAS